MTSFAQHILTMRDGQRIVTPCAMDLSAEAPPERVKVTWPSGRTGHPLKRFMVRANILEGLLKPGAPMIDRLPKTTMPGRRPGTKR